MPEYAIIVAGGQGSRLGGSIPKQFLLLQGKPMLMHSAQAFLSYNNHIRLIIVLPADAINQWKDLCEKHRFIAAHQVIAGGSERFHSVRNGLSLIPGDEGLVAVHDAARPLVSPTLIANCFGLTRNHKAVVPVVHPTESLRKLGAGGTSQSVDRSEYRMVQTPQCFQVDILKRAYLQEYSNTFTDDASVVEAMGETVTLIEGEATNIKITVPGDLQSVASGGSAKADSG
jgi:2-C-methyl-D-erythritol 4-phosphate cytidylyltransferase